MIDELHKEYGKENMREKILAVMDVIFTTTGLTLNVLSISGIIPIAVDAVSFAINIYFIVRLFMKK